MIYTKNNPKPVYYFADPEEDNFTGVVKDRFRIIAYYQNGKFHRTDGPAIVIMYFNCKIWFYNGKFYGENYAFTDESWIKMCSDIWMIKYVFILN